MTWRGETPATDAWESAQLRLFYDAAYRRFVCEKARNLRRSERTRCARAIRRHTEDEWLSLTVAFRNCCASCGISGFTTRLHRDHILPIVRGGHDGIDNIQPLCGRCNDRKGRTSTDFRTIQGMTHVA